MGLENILQLTSYYYNYTLINIKCQITINECQSKVAFCEKKNEYKDRKKYKDIV